MKKLRAYLVVLVLLGIAPVSHASVNTNLESERLTATSINQESSIMLAANPGMQAGLENQLVASGIKATQSGNVVPVSTAGIIFALLLLGMGSLVGRKKKVKANDIVGAFARSN